MLPVPSAKAGHAVLDSWSLPRFAVAGNQCLQLAAWALAAEKHSFAICKFAEPIDLSLAKNKASRTIVSESCSATNFNCTRSRTFRTRLVLTILIEFLIRPLAGLPRGRLCVRVGDPADA